MFNFQQIITFYMLIVLLREGISNEFLYSDCGLLQLKESPRPPVHGILIPGDIVHVGSIRNELHSHQE